MENKNFCQSCSMPLDHAGLRGTEKDGTKSNEYCTFCYREGSFLNPDMKLEEMKVLVKEKMEEKKIDPSVINMALSNLPYLKRWRERTVAY